MVEEADSRADRISAPSAPAAASRSAACGIIRAGSTERSRANRSEARAFVAAVVVQLPLRLEWYNVIYPGPKAPGLAPDPDCP